MISSDNFTEEQQTILTKVEKLMRLAAKNANENEAASATAKAMDLLAAYNLTSAQIDISGDSGKRAEEKLIGGFYKFERDLWRAIAELNFVWYFTRLKYIPHDERHLHRSRTHTHQHVMIGKLVNIITTRNMAQSLMQTIERLTKVNYETVNMPPRSSWSTSFRRGVAERVIEKLERKRWDLLEEEEKRVAEAAEKARKAGVSNVETGLTLATVKEREDEGNYDFIHGAGAFAKRRADSLRRRQQMAEAEAAAQAEYTAWAAAHSEEAAKQEADAIKAERRRANRRTGRWRSSAPAFQGDWSAYSMGREAGKNVGISTEVDSARPVKGRLQ